MDVAAEEYDKGIAAMLDGLPERVIRYKVPELTILYCNVAWSAGHGLEPSDVIGHNLVEFLTPPQIVVLREHLELLTPLNRIIANRAQAPDDAGQWVDWVDRFLPGTDAQDGDEVVAVGRDATERYVAELRLVGSEARFRELADRSADVVWRFYAYPTPHFDYMSPAVEHILGYTPELFLSNFSHFLDILDEQSRAFVVAAFNGGPPLLRTDLCFRCANGQIVIGETLATPIRGGLQGISRDVTELRGLQDKLASLALRDPLTGLANRRLLDELLDQALAHIQASDRTLTALFLDLDHFKMVNDTYGHEAGDIVLRETALRLLGLVRSGEIVARLGGDEFVIVCENDRAGAERLVVRIEAALAVPIAVSDTVSICCRASIGLADTASVGNDAAELIAAADAAMYAVKESHRRPPRG